MKRRDGASHRSVDLVTKMTKGQWGEVLIRHDQGECRLSKGDGGNYPTKETNLAPKRAMLPRVAGHWDKRSWIKPLSIRLLSLKFWKLVSITRKFGTYARLLKGGKTLPLEGCQCALQTKRLFRLVPLFSKRAYVPIYGLFDKDILF